MTGYFQKNIELKTNINSIDCSLNSKMNPGFVAHLILHNLS